MRAKQYGKSILTVCLTLTLALTCAVCGGASGNAPEELVQYSALYSPYAVLMEVTRYPPYGMEERLKIRNAVKNVHPDCKVVLVVDENSETEAADRVRQAKKDGLIDQFIYGSISPAYLVALMDTL